MLPADRRQASFGPEVSWPAGYPDMEYRDGDYRYTAPEGEQPPASPHGHPYAAFTSAGYGDDGYRDPGYQGPAAQDAGIAGTRTVRGFVEAGPGWGQPGYPAPDGYAQSSYQQPGYGQSDYAGSSYASAGEIEMAYPPNAMSAEAYHGADSHRQPWDYDQPLRYDDGEVAYQPQGDYPAGGEYQSVNYLSGAYPIPGYDDRRPAPGYDPDVYNGSDYSTPGIGGTGYDLAGIIGTSDFEAVGYDEPSYDRLAYDDPRYGEGHGYGNSRSPFDSAGFDVPGFDETRLDNLWLPGEDVRHEAAPVGYGNDGFGDPPGRSGYSDFNVGQPGRFEETRFDMSAVDLRADHTRFDVPAFDETRIESLRRTSTDLLAVPGRAGAAALLAPPPLETRAWVEDTSFDHFADLDLTDEPVPAAFTRTIERPPAEDDTAARRATGRRRGRSGDRRQWMALGAIAVVAAGAIGMVLMKYVHNGPKGPEHQISAPATVDGYTASATLASDMHVGVLAQEVAKSSGPSVSNVVAAVYQQGAITPGSNAQIFMFVGGKIASSDPNALITNFDQSYAGTRPVPAGSLGGDASCTETHVNGEEEAMCVWFDNDTFGALVSPTMTTTQLASTMTHVRPNLETVAATR